jgi:hypothetical protein
MAGRAEPMSGAMPCDTSHRVTARAAASSNRSATRPSRRDRRSFLSAAVRPTARWREACVEEAGKAFARTVRLDASMVEPDCGWPGREVSAARTTGSASWRALSRQRTHRPCSAIWPRSSAGSVVDRPRPDRRPAVGGSAPARAGTGRETPLRIPDHRRGQGRDGLASRDRSREAPWGDHRHARGVLRGLTSFADSGKHGRTGHRSVAQSGPLRPEQIQCTGPCCGLITRSAVLRRGESEASFMQARWWRRFLPSAGFLPIDCLHHDNA